MRHTVHNTSEAGIRLRVFVNGNEVESAVSADTETGVVVYAPKPYRAARGKDYVYTRKLRGKVTVEPI